VDSATNLYVADYNNNTIRKVTPAGVVTTLAGLARSIGSADGTGSTARFIGPTGVAVDSADNVYVADEHNNTIRKVTPVGTNWVVRTLAGLAGPLSANFPDSADGTGSAARFSNPFGLAVDGAGNLYVADSNNNTIRKGYPAPMILNSGPAFGFTAGQFGFDLTGPSGQLVIVEASPDLSNWLPIWTNTLGANALPFSDPQAVLYPHRFYRARLP
jgi:sugar lactone lactonase YvrE